MPKTTLGNTPTTLIRLRTAVQQYPWGKQGSASLAARLAKNSVGPDFSIDESKTYAEIWMGTHPNGPSHLYDAPDTSLHSIVASNPAVNLPPSSTAQTQSKVPVPATSSDSPTAGGGGTHIPFLFKILSIQKALPLQAHPDKDLGARLRSQHPDLAPDANHKPEIAVAIGAPLEDAREGESFTGFVGFRPLEDVAASLRNVHELRQAVGDEQAVDAFVREPNREGLKRVWGALLKKGPSGEVKPFVEKLAERVQGGGTDGLTEEQAWLVNKVSQQYPGDAGVFATTFFMNFAKLRKGEALWIGADEVHAYLEGDIIECMAISDNVLNAAFSPPSELAAQIPIFVDMLTYTARPAGHWALPPKAYARGTHGRTTAYDPPLEEFAVLRTVLGNREGREVLKVRGPLVGIVTKGAVAVSSGGEDMVLDEGGVVYVVHGGAGEREVGIELKEAGVNGEGEVWWAVCE
ncbi:RmlC-like cupin domain-containing protein [Fomitopsis serialis]|uniref:RmlC-like cupin domain-containing protein n=1 Tax=Fomitopsis serialis TaxID=139415 RepID=UPI002008006B|nr:RmlC-like cupin domain-containing protein [Neoantrodia serialis]KAH9929240.1 RmlC-like cupin domain-containing protein [Neoantrodia serialis]